MHKKQQICCFLNLGKVLKSVVFYGKKAQKSYFGVGVIGRQKPFWSSISRDFVCFKKFFLQKWYSKFYIDSFLEALEYCKVFTYHLICLNLRQKISKFWWFCSKMGSQPELTLVKNGSNSPSAWKYDISKFGNLLWNIFSISWQKEGVKKWVWKKRGFV